MATFAVSPALRAFGGGLAIAAAAPPFPPWTMPASWLGLALLASTIDAQRPGRSLAHGLLFGATANAIVFSFVPATITRFTELPIVAAYAMWILLACAQGLAFALLAWVAALAARSGAPFALAFCLGAALAVFVPQLFPWTAAALLGRAPLLLQAADVFGERGVAIALALMGALIAIAVRRGDPRARSAAAAGAVLVPVLLTGYGALRVRGVDAAGAAAPHKAVGLVQQAVPPRDRWRPDLAPSILDKLWSLTRRAEQRGATLVVWPEAAYPYVLDSGPGIDDGPSRIRGPGVRAEVITGLLTSVEGAERGDASGDHYNAAILATRDGHLSRAAAKLELLAFGEAVPFGERVPALRRVFARGGGLRPGRDVVILSAGPSGTTRDGDPVARVGVLNCYEDTLPGVARRVAAARPNLLVNVTNDAWFGATVEPELHLLASIPRAIEVRRDIVRAVNTGVTAHVDAVGRVVSRAPREEPAVLVVQAALLEDPPTLYARFGDWTWGGVLCAAIVAHLRGRWRRGQRPSPWPQNNEAPPV